MKIIQINEESIVFDTGRMLCANRVQDYRIEMYIDLNILKYYKVKQKNNVLTNIYNVEFDVDLKIEPVPNKGFNLVAINGSKYFVPCYNLDEDYYTCDLVLILKK